MNPPAPRVRGSLLRKYVFALLLAVGVPLGLYSAVSLLFVYRQHSATLAEVQHLQARAAAQRIAQFVQEIQGQLQWATHLPWDDDPAALAQRRLDALRLLRQVPAVTDLLLLDGRGRERLAVSRLNLNDQESGTDRSQDPAFAEAVERRVHFGPVTFRRETEPFMRLAVAGARREAGVVIADVNLKHIWDVVAHIRVGEGGRAWVVDREGRLIAHPDISLVLRNTDLNDRLPGPGDAVAGDEGRSGPVRMTSPSGAPVRASWVAAEPLDWRVFVEVPEDEAQAPLREALLRAGVIGAASLLLAVACAVGLSWRMVRPIRALTDGVARIGGGQLGQRIAIHTRDELETLGQGFNEMATALEEARSGLERQVEQRTHELSEANRAKSRLLAAASHDLRQPLHALNLLVAQLGQAGERADRDRLTRHVESSMTSINGLFDSLLDLSRLDAGVVAPQFTSLPVQRCLDRLASTFEADAVAKGLRLRIRPCADWVRSDPVLLERILGNLVGNAVRYTARGGIVVGVRRHGERLRIDVWDTGAGIAPDRQAAVFREFYQVAPGSGRSGEGLGLGLAIVARLCELLGHRVELASRPGRGSRFSIVVPRTAPLAEPDRAAVVPPRFDPMPGRRVLILDDDARVLESTAGLFAGWGCDVVMAAGLDDAIARLGRAAPDLVIADLHLGEAADGADAVAALRARYGGGLAAFLVSGDVGPSARRRAAEAGLPMLDKPVPPLRLRALASRLLIGRSGPTEVAHPAASSPGR